MYVHTWALGDLERLVYWGLQLDTVDAPGSLASPNKTCQDRSSAPALQATLQIWMIKWAS
jgi:hypothetical protein